MININDSEKIEKYIECGISKIIGSSFVNPDNIYTVLNKLLKYNDKYDESKGMSYSSYIHMLIKTECYRIYKNTISKKRNQNKNTTKYANFLKRNQNKNNEKNMVLVDSIMENSQLSEYDKSIIRMHFIEGLSIKHISELLNIKKSKLYVLMNNILFQLNKNYSNNIDNLKIEVERKYGKIID